MSAAPRAGGGPSVGTELVRFGALFDEGAYWESHEVLEGPWRESGSDLLQGLILLASAWVHVERSNGHGVQAQLRKALERLERVEEDAAPAGLDVPGVRRYVRWAYGRVRAVRALVPSDADDPGGGGEAVDWPRLLPPLHLGLSPPVSTTDDRRRDDVRTPRP